MSSEYSFPSIGCIVMASGLSTRFGSDKLMESFLGKPLILHIIDTLRTLPFVTFLVVTRSEGVLALCQRERIPVLHHALPLRSDALKLGLEKLQQSGPFAGYLFCQGDQPLVSASSVKHMAHSLLEHPDGIFRLSFEDQLASPILFSSDYLPELFTLTGKSGGGFLAKKYPKQVHAVPAWDSLELFDIDTPEDLSFLLGKYDV